MRSLRAQVAALEQEELFEGIMQRTSQGAFEQRPSSNSIDSIMDSLLGPPTSVEVSNSTPTKSVRAITCNDDIMLGADKKDNVYVKI